MNVQSDLGDFRDSTFGPRCVPLHWLFGMDKNKELILASKGHSDRLLLVSDNTHNCFLKGYMDIADYCIASLRKWFSPDGAVAVSNRSSLGRCLFLRKMLCRFAQSHDAQGRLLSRWWPGFKSLHRKLLADAKVSSMILRNPLGFHLFRASYWISWLRKDEIKTKEEL